MIKVNLSIHVKSREAKIHESNLDKTKELLKYYDYKLIAEDTNRLFSDIKVSGDFFHLQKLIMNLEEISKEMNCYYLIDTSILTSSKEQKFGLSIANGNIQDYAFKSPITVNAEKLNEFLKSI